MRSLPCVLVLGVASLASAVELASPPPPPTAIAPAPPEGRLVGVPIDAPDQLLGVGEHAIVYAQLIIHELPVLGATQTLTGCTIHVEGARGSHVEWTLGRGPGVVVDGVAAMRWREEPGVVPAGLGGWRARLRKLAAPDTSCEQLIGALRAEVKLRPPRPRAAPPETDFEDAIEEVHVTGTRVLEGPDARSLLLAGLRGKDTWRYRVVRLDGATR